MSKKSKKDAHKMSVDDLQSKIAEAEQQYQVMKMGHKITPIENPMRIREQRREIARYKTLLTQKQAEQK